MNTLAAGYYGCPEIARGANREASIHEDLAERSQRSKVFAGQRRSTSVQSAVKLLAIAVLHALALYALSRDTVQQAVMNVITAELIAIELPVAEPISKPAVERKSIDRTEPTRHTPPPQKAENPTIDLPALALETQSLANPVVATNLNSASTERATTTPSTSAMEVNVSPSSPPIKPAVVPAPRVELPSSNADYLNNPPPPYPAQSKRMREQGTVVLRVFVSASGAAQLVEIKQSCGFSRLDEIARDTVAKWKFVPGTRNGVAEAMWVSVPIIFELD